MIPLGLGLIIDEVPFELLGHAFHDPVTFMISFCSKKTLFCRVVICKRSTLECCFLTKVSHIELWFAKKLQFAT